MALSHCLEGERPIEFGQFDRTLEHIEECGCLAQARGAFRASNLVGTPKTMVNVYLLKSGHLTVLKPGVGEVVSASTVRLESPLAFEAFQSSTMSGTRYFPGAVGHFGKNIWAASDPFHLS
jgi:hypothetical protein